MIRVLSAAFGAVLLAAPSLVSAQQARPAAVTPAAASTAPGVPAHPVQSYASEGEAKSHCGSDLVVWGNPRSKVYHFSGAKAYGKTKRGAYMCRKEGDTEGYHAARGEKVPTAN